MIFFQQFYLDREKDLAVELNLEGERLFYTIRTPNHHSGNLIMNLAKICGLKTEEDDRGLKILRGEVPCYFDGGNRRMYIFRLGNTKVANIYPDGRVELKASIPAISKTLMSQTRDYRLGEAKTIVKTYIRSECKFRTDLHTHMNGNLPPDALIALGIVHQIRYPYYYIKKLGLRCSPDQTAKLERRRARAEQELGETELTGKHRDRKIDDRTFLNFAELILGNPGDAQANIGRIRNSLTIPKDGQAVFDDLEKVYLYRYVFTRGVAAEDRFSGINIALIPDREVFGYAEQMCRDRETERYGRNTLYQDLLLWIAREYRRRGIEYVEISDTGLLNRDRFAAQLREIHEILPVITRETGVLIRFLAAVRRVPLTIIRDRVTPNDYLAGNLRILKTIAGDPYVAGSDIVGEEINDILELRAVIREMVRIAGENEGFVIRIHAGENDSLRNNVANSLACVTEALEPGQRMPSLRIGHGLYTRDLRTPGGQKLLEDLRKNGVTLEFQITSNVRLNNLSRLDHHPLKQYLAAGIDCVQGTDGGALYGTDSIDEELSLEKLLGLGLEELSAMAAADRRILAESHESLPRRRRGRGSGKMVPAPAGGDRRTGPGSMEGQRPGRRLGGAAGPDRAPAGASDSRDRRGRQLQPQRPPGDRPGGGPAAAGPAAGNAGSGTGLFRDRPHPDRAGGVSGGKKPGALPPGGDRSEPDYPRGKKPPAEIRRFGAGFDRKLRPGAVQELRLRDFQAEGGPEREVSLRHFRQSALPGAGGEGEAAGRLCPAAGKPGGNCGRGRTAAGRLKRKEE